MFTRQATLNPAFYVDQHAALDVGPVVQQRIRALARETGVAEQLPEGWSLQHLEVGAMPGMLDLPGDTTDTP